MLSNPGKYIRLVFPLSRNAGQRGVCFAAGDIPDIDQPLDSGTEVKLHVPALIPESYLPDITTRLVLYKRIAQAHSDSALRDIQVEMIDRFGLLPDPVKNLFTCAQLRVTAQKLGISEIDMTDEGGSIEFKASTAVEPAAIVKLIQTEPLCYSLSAKGKLRVKKHYPLCSQERNL